MQKTRQRYLIKTWNMSMTSPYLIFKIQMILQKMKVEKIFTVEGNFTWLAVVTILYGIGK